MAIIPAKKRNDFKAQLDSIQEKINEIKTSREQQSSAPLATAPTGKTLGATSTGPSKALRDLSIDLAPDKPELTQEKVKGKSIVNLSIGLANQYNDQQARVNTAKENMRKNQMSQISANTSFSFTPDMLKQTQRAIDKFGFALNDVNNDPFEPKEFKDEGAKNTIEVTSKELGRLFQNSDQLYEAYKTNAAFKGSFDKFIKKGGTLEGVSKNISAPMTVDNQITNAMVDRGELPESSREMYAQNVQTPDQYLASLSNPNANQAAQKMALEELAPESSVAQQEIMRVANIPKELQTLYFGDERTIGVLQMKQAQAKERKSIIEEQERDTKRTVRERAELSMERNRVEVEQTKSKIEENRLAAKNYMTAQLAKLGALNTSGAAPLALQILETKYQGQVVQIESNFKLAERQIEIGLAENIDEIENSTNEKVLKIEEDITTDRETSVKEILKARQASDKEIYTITEQYSRRLRERTTSYTEDLKKEAEEYAKKFAKKASNGLNLKTGFTAAGNPATNSKAVSQFEQQLQSARGSDGYVNSQVYARLMNEWIKKGGTVSTFKSKFPPVNYANPDDKSLPPQLRYAKESQTLPKDKDEEDDFEGF